MAARNPTPIGEKFNNLTVIGEAPPKNQKSHVVVRCDCGIIKTVSLHKIKFGATKSCGCLLRSRYPDPEVGFRSGKLVVIGPFFVRGEFRWATCKCDCGATYEAKTYLLRNGKATSCRCMQAERFVKHGFTRMKNGISRPRVYTVWRQMKSRCTNPSNKAYQNYGGRGITVCDRWINSFENFLADMGEPSAGMSLDRIRVNEGYSPSNCRWATLKEQQNNKRTNIMVEFGGERLTVTQWSERTGIPYHTLRWRIVSGWPAEKALTEPKRKNQFC